MKMLIIILAIFGITLSISGVFLVLQAITLRASGLGNPQYLFDAAWCVYGTAAVVVVAFWGCITWDIRRMRKG